jgi:hypothetical protein
MANVHDDDTETLQYADESEWMDESAEDADYSGYKECGHPEYRNTDAGPQVNDDCGCEPAADPRNVCRTCGFSHDGEDCPRWEDLADGSILGGMAAFRRDWAIREARQALAEIGAGADYVYAGGERVVKSADADMWRAARLGQLEAVAGQLLAVIGEAGK